MKSLQSKILILVILLSFACTNKAIGQEPDETPVKIDTVLINVPLIVSDKDGRNIVGLKKENFSIFQQGEKQTIEFFADVEEPMNVAIIIDTSGSTGGVLRSIKKSAKEFLLTFRPEDKGMVISFDDEIHILGKLTSDKGKLKDAINEASTISQGVWDVPKTRTAMFDAIYQVVAKDFVEIKGKKAIILLTDSFEGGNKISLGQMLDVLTEADSLVFPIIYQTYNLSHFFPKNTKTVTLADLLSLPMYYKVREFAELTGGRVYSADADDFNTAFKSISDQLTKQYLIGFYPTKLDGGKSASIKIEVDRKDAIVRSKRTIRLKTPDAKNKEKTAH